MAKRENADHRAHEAHLASILGPELAIRLLLVLGPAADEYYSKLSLEQLKTKIIEIFQLGKEPSDAITAAYIQKGGDAVVLRELILGKTSLPESFDDDEAPSLG